MPEYVYPEVLVSTEWVAEHLTDPTVRIVGSGAAFRSRGPPIFPPGPNTAGETPFAPGGSLTI